MTRKEALRRELVKRLYDFACVSQTKDKLGKASALRKVNALSEEYNNEPGAGDTVPLLREEKDYPLFDWAGIKLDEEKHEGRA